MSERIKKINDLIKQKISEIITKKVCVNLNAILTITKVETSIDLKYAKIYFTALPEDKMLDVLNELNLNVYNIQKELNKEIKTKFVPKIRFLIDKQAIAEQRVYELLQKEKKKK